MPSQHLSVILLLHISVSVYSWPAKWFIVSVWCDFTKLIRVTPENLIIHICPELFCEKSQLNKHDWCCFPPSFAWSTPMLMDLLPFKACQNPTSNGTAKLSPGGASSRWSTCGFHSRNGMVRPKEIHGNPEGSARKRQVGTPVCSCFFFPLISPCGTQHQLVQRSKVQPQKIHGLGILWMYRGTNPARLPPLRGTNQEKSTPIHLVGSGIRFFFWTVWDHFGPSPLYKGICMFQQVYDHFPMKTTVSNGCSNHVWFPETKHGRLKLGRWILHGPPKWAQLPQNFPMTSRCLVISKLMWK